MTVSDPMALFRLKPLFLLGLGPVVLRSYAGAGPATRTPAIGRAGRARRNGSRRVSRIRLAAIPQETIRRRHRRRSSTRRSSSSAAAAAAQPRSVTRLDPCRSMSSRLPTCARATPIWPTSCACSCRPSMSTRKRTAPPSSVRRACGVLAPDHTLVLVNGKRRHRGAEIAWQGNGVADGAQGPDISTIPAIALRGIEVLRDGAAAQYGSDAIAGVLNFLLKDDRDGGSVELSSGTHAAGGRPGIRRRRQHGPAARPDRLRQPQPRVRQHGLHGPERAADGRGGPRRGRESSRRRPRPAMGSPASRRRSQAPRQPRPPVGQRRAGVRPRELRAPGCAHVLLLSESQHAGRRVQ